MADKNFTLTQEYLVTSFRYDGVGQLVWRNTKRKDLIGKVAGTIDGRGYIQVKIKQKHYGLHRLIFMYHNGYLPELVDHRDQNKNNNRIFNLRDADKSINGLNRGLQSNNKSGHKGIHWHKQANRWQVQFKLRNKPHYLGLFKELNEAKKVAQKFIEENHK